MILANRLVGNPIGAAAIEVTLGGSHFGFNCDTSIALCGADMGVELNGVKVPMWRSISVKSGSEITFSQSTHGVRTYLSVSGSFDTPEILGSRSTHIPSKFGNKALKRGDIVPISQNTTLHALNLQLPNNLIPKYSDHVVLRVIQGPQQYCFSNIAKHIFYSSVFVVTSASDRQGMRLDGPTVPIRNPSGSYDIISDAVPLGSIQITANGPIILLADRQTTGGYAKIGVVASVDIPMLAQITTGGKINFKLVSVQEAQRALISKRQELLQTSLTTYNDYIVHLCDKDTKNKVSINVSPEKQYSVIQLDREQIPYVNQEDILQRN